VLGKHRQPVLGNVEVAVIEAERDRVPHRPTPSEHRRGSQDVDDDVALVGEVPHLPGKPVRRDRELVVLRRDAVVEEDPDAVGLGSPACAQAPRGRAAAGEQRLGRVERRRRDVEPGRPARHRSLRPRRMTRPAATRAGESPS
jgi:hypothetical protein